MASLLSWCDSVGEPRYTPLFARRHKSLLIIAITTVCAMIFTLGYSSVRIHRCKCNCQGAAPCELWSCDTPLAHSLRDDWPAWPPAGGVNAIPRDNLPDHGAEARWRALHRQHMEEAQQAKPSTEIAFLGDSITEGWIRSGFSGRKPSIAQPACEELWKAAFGRWAPLNLAIGGDRAQDLGWRLQHGLLPAALQPKVFFVMIGINDLGAGEQWEVVAAEVQLLVEQLHAARPHAHVVLHALLPRGADAGEVGTASFHRSPWWSAAQNAYAAAIPQINARLHALAQRKGSKGWLHWLDCSHLFLARAAEPTDQLPTSHRHDEPSSSAEEPPPRMYIPTHLMYDLLHLTPEGYRLWAECLKPRLAEAVGAASSSTPGGTESGAGAGGGTAAARGRSAELEQANGPSAAARAGMEPTCVGRSCRGNNGGLDLP